jgi:hypothetical protein
MTANCCWMSSSLLASVDVIAFEAVEAYSNSDRTNVNCNTYEQPGDESPMVME